MLVEGPDGNSTLSKPDEALWELIFESLPDMVALIDSRNRLMKANKAMLHFMETSQIEALGRHCFHLMHETSCSLENCPHNQMMRDGQVHEEEIFEPRTKKHLHITTTPVFSDKGTLLGSVHIARDITSQKLYEEKLEQYNLELEELNNSKDKFFSIVAHDLRSPFQGVIGFADLILDSYDKLNIDEVRKYIRHIRESSHAAYVMLENLLNWSRMETGRLNFNPEPICISYEVDRVISSLNSNALRKNISILNQLNSDLKVLADKQMVFSILLNLLSNAIKFSYKDSEIAVSGKVISVCESGDPSNCEHPQHYLQVRVADHGIGMSKATRELILAHKEHVSAVGTGNETGAGIGLMIVREMIDKHGSKLHIQSQEGEGSVFSFDLQLL